MSATITQLETLTLTCDTDDCGAFNERMGRYRHELMRAATEDGWRAYQRADMDIATTYGPVRYACPECSLGVLR